ncbi:hypothetical protein PIB30_090761 [Stylosanthes scabra]|uniref:Transposase MuDR plant domain-containing protein n=1 Tax=Stylosanthes scabra TaxID=79078 RepID=A0ABU6UV26_9FABA|nr:hypothetical protein [Stylosanthes scabra]
MEKYHNQRKGVMFSCEEPVWVMIPSLVSLLDLKNVILVNLGEVGRKEVTRIFYRMPVAVANTFVYRKMPLRTDQNLTMMFSYHRDISSVFAIELCVQLQDVGGSSSSSNHVDSGRGININDAVRIPPNRRASNLDDDQAGANSDGGDDDEFIPETQLPNAEQAMGLATITVPLRRVSEEAGHYLTINEEGMHSGSAMEIGLKFSNREIAMLAVKNYNIRRSAEFKVVESDRARYVCKCKQFGPQCQWMIRVAKTKSSRF